MSGRKKSVRISEAEWRIMNVLWESCNTEQVPGLTLGDIVRQLDDDVDWTKTTIRTLIIRLADKGIVRIDKTTGVYKYTPVVQKSDCVRDELNSFVARVFNNSPYQLMASLVKEGTLTERERKEIIDILKNIE